MKMTVILLMLISSTAWSQSAARTSVDGLVDVAAAIDPSLSNGEVMRAMDAVMGGDCRACGMQGPQIDESCKVIPNILANKLEASRGITRIFGTENSRACGTLTYREGVSFNDLLTLGADDSYSLGDSQITIQDPERGEVRMSINHFGVGVRLDTDAISEGSSIRVGADNNSVGGTIKLKIGRKSH